jgi:hypothetical protein
VEKLKPMKNTIKIIYSLLIIFCGINFKLQAQTPDRQTEKDLPYLKELREALFPPDEPKISAKEHPKCKEEDEWSSRYRDWTQIDTIIMVRLHQPDKKQVCELLLKIAMTKNYAYFQGLMDMYEQHQEIFKQEWEYLLINYAPVCEANQHPVTIMQGFEHTLYALELAHKKVSQDELIRLYDKNTRGFYEHRFFKSEDRKIELQKRREIDDQINYYSPYFKDIRGYGWAAFGPGFSFYTPFLDVLEDHIVNKIRSLDVQKHKFKGINNDYENFIESNVIQSTILGMRHLKSTKFEEAIQEKYEEIDRVGWSYDLSRYVQLNPQVSAEFVRFILDRTFEGQRLIDDYNRIGTFSPSFAFLIHDHTRPVIKEYMLQKTSSDNPVARAVSLGSLVYFTNDPEVLQLMLDKSKQKRLSEEEARVLRNNFQRMLKAPDFPEESKAMVQKQYEKMKKKNKYKN